MARRSWSDADKVLLGTMTDASVAELMAAFPDRSIDAITSKLTRIARSEPHTAPSVPSDPQPGHRGTLISAQPLHGALTYAARWGW